jgi:hypothetical protein
MASLNTGSAQVTQRVNPGLVDPRLLGADLSRIGQGIGQGMGLVNDYYATKEQAALRPIRRGLADFQLAAAQEQAAGAENRRALADLNFQLAKGQVDNLPAQKTLRDIQIAAAQRQAQKDSTVPTLVANKGTVKRNARFDAVTGTHLPEVTYQVQSWYNPSTGGLEDIQVPGGEVSFTDAKARDERAGLENELLTAEIGYKEAQAAIAKATASMKGTDRAKVKEWAVTTDPKTGLGVATPLGDNAEVLGAPISLGGFVSAEAMKVFNDPVRRAMEEDAAKPKKKSGGWFNFGGDKESESGLNDLVVDVNPTATNRPAVNPVTAPFTGVGAAANPAKEVGPAVTAPVPTDADISAAQQRINELKGEKGIVSLEGSPLAGLVRKPTVASDTPRVAAPDARTQSYIKANEARKVKGAEKTLADIELLLEQGGKIRMDRSGRKTVVPLSEKEAMELEKDRLSAIKILGLE